MNTIPVPSSIKDSSFKAVRRVLSRDPVPKRLASESHHVPAPKYGVLVTCFCSNGGFSSKATLSPVCSAPNGDCSFLLQGKATEQGRVLEGEVRGEVNKLEGGVTKVREWFVGSGDRARDESDKPEVSCESENTSG